MANVMVDMRSDMRARIEIGALEDSVEYCAENARTDRNQKSGTRNLL